MQYDHNTIFSTREFVESWCRAFSDCEPVSVQVVGSGPSRTMYVVKTLLKYASYTISAGRSDDLWTSPGWTGTLDRSTVQTIIDQLSGVRMRSLHWQVRFDHEPLARTLDSLGLVHSLVPIHILNLERDHERVFARHNPTIRNHVRKAGRRGVLVRRSHDVEDVLAYQAIYSKVAQDKDWRFTYPMQLTLDLIKFPYLACFKVAEHEGTIIGGALFLRDGNSVYYLHGVADRKYSHLYPASAVLNSGVSWGCEIGAEFFNFGNSGQIKSLAQFKSYWGAHPEHNWLFKRESPIWNTAIKMKTVARSLLFEKPQGSVVHAADHRRALHALPWSRRAELGELKAVCNAAGSDRKNLMIHGTSLFGAKKALLLARKQRIQQPVVLDFGCGTGRMIRFFAKHGCRVLGVDTTIEMLKETQKYGLARNSWLSHFDGLTIPAKDNSIDVVWICGVLKYTLFPPGSSCRHGNDWSIQADLANAGASTSKKQHFIPTYAEIAKEMYRVLKPGGIVANYEMHVDEPAGIFTPAFERAGFATEQISVLRKPNGKLEALFEWRDSCRLPSWLVLLMARISAETRYHSDYRACRDGEFRDYFFVWRKP
jgi:ubiquinone/menaquinone biosynthesis C-methylase UbiE